MILYAIFLFQTAFMLSLCICQLFCIMYSRPTSELSGDYLKYPTLEMKTSKKLVNNSNKTLGIRLLLRLMEACTCKTINNILYQNYCTCLIYLYGSKGLSPTSINIKKSNWNFIYGLEVKNHTVNSSDFLPLP